MTTGDFVDSEIQGSTVVVRFSNPPVNALSRRLLVELGQHVSDIAGHPAVGAIVLHGTGRAFAAGGDIEELAAVSSESALGYALQVQYSVGQIALAGVPVIAAVHGFALGGGTEIALASDFRVCSEDASFGLPEVLLGLIPGTGGTQRLQRLIGVSRAKELIYSGRTIDSQEAFRIGLVDQVVAREALLSSALVFAERFAKSSPAAVRAAKFMIDRGPGIDLDAALRSESETFAALFDTVEAEIGLRSFVETGRLGNARYGE